jgi:glucans biosynthesis protein C
MSHPLTQNRYHELDWLRVLAVLLVLFFHVGMIFVRWDFHIKSQDTSRVLEQIMMFTHLWRMPLLLLVSGAGTFFAMRYFTGLQYLGERCRRLLLPFIACIPIVVSPQVYIERLDRYPDYLTFMLHSFEGIYPEGGNFSWHHLWFILYLFSYTLLLLPLLLWLRDGGAARLNSRLLPFLSQRGGLLYLVLPILLTQFALRPHFPEENHTLIYDWAFFVYYGCFFFFGYLFASEGAYFELLLEQRRNFLVASLIATAALYAEYWLVYPYHLALWLKFDDLFGLTEICLAWFWVLTFTGYARRYLTHKPSWLAWANENVYPFYIWHQAVIVVAGYHMAKWPLGLWTRFALIALFSFTVTLLLCELVKRFRLTRLIFGLKPRPSQHAKPQAGLNSTEA